MGLDDDDDRYIKDSRHKVPKLHIRYLNHFLKFSSFFYMRKYVDSQAEFFTYFECTLSCEYLHPYLILALIKLVLGLGTLGESKESFYLYFISPKVHLWRMNAMNAFAITIQKLYNYA